MAQVMRELDNVAVGLVGPGERVPQRTLIIMPTYQEAANIGDLLERVRQSAPSAEVLVVDDSSPDGTAELAHAAGKVLGGVHVYVRPSKSGLGSAYRDGLRWGLTHGYNVLVNMDADGSHDPTALAALIAPISGGADVVLGSRYCRGGRVVAWPLRRRLLSRLGNRYATAILGLGVRDATAGFRAYRADWLRTFDLSRSDAAGYCVHVEMTYRCRQAGATIVEVPITFQDRTQGQSKMSGRIVFETFRKVTRWGLQGQHDVGTTDNVVDLRTKVAQA